MGIHRTAITKNLLELTTHPALRGMKLTGHQVRGRTPRELLEDCVADLPGPYCLQGLPRARRSAEAAGGQSRGYLAPSRRTGAARDRAGGAKAGSRTAKEAGEEGGCGPRGERLSSGSLVTGSGLGASSS
jgi:hypothetical protein